MNKPPRKSHGVFKSSIAIAGAILLSSCGVTDGPSSNTQAVSSTIVEVNGETEVLHNVALEENLNPGTSIEGILRLTADPSDEGIHIISPLDGDSKGYSVVIPLLAEGGSGSRSMAFAVWHEEEGVDYVRAFLYDEEQEVVVEPPSLSSAPTPLTEDMQPMISASSQGKHYTVSIGYSQEYPELVKVSILED